MASKHLAERGRFSILVVEDDESVRYALSRTIRAAGFKTMEAASGAEALEFAEYVTAVVMDIQLPDLMGWEVCRLIRKNPSTSNRPTIHITSRHTSEADAETSRACGALAHFVHPVEPQLLIDTLDLIILSM